MPNPISFRENPVSDWFSDVANDGVRALATGVVDAANWAMLTAMDLLRGGLRVNVAADYVQSTLELVRYLVLPLIAVLFVVQVIRAIVAGQPKLLGAALVGALVGVLGGAAAAALVAGMLAVVDEFTNFVLGDAQEKAEHAMAQVFSMQGMSVLGWLVVVIVGGLAIIAFLMIMGVMIVRKAMIIATVVFGPLAFAGATTDRSRKWVWRWAELVIGLALAKLVIAVILTLGFAALDSWQTNTTSDVIVGVCWVMLAAGAPLAVMKFVSFAGGEIANAHTSGLRQAAANVATPTRRVGAKMAGAAGAGWAMATSGSGTITPRKAASPGEAAGGPNHASSSAPGIGSQESSEPSGAATSSQGGSTTSTAGSVSGSGPSGGPGSGRRQAGVPQPTQSGSSGDSRDSDSAKTPGNVTGVPAAAGGRAPGSGSAGRAASVRTDAQAQPELQALLTRSWESGGRRPSVHPSGVARAMGLPEPQVERMLMKSEAAGLVGPQDMQGRRQVLKPQPRPAGQPVGASGRS